MDNQPATSGSEGQSLAQAVASQNAVKTAPYSIPMAGMGQPQKVPMPLVQPPMPGIPSPAAKKKNKSWLGLLMLIIILVGLGGGGYYAWSNGWLNQVISVIPIPMDFLKTDKIVTDSTADLLANDSLTESITPTSAQGELVAPVIPDGWLVGETSCGMTVGYPSNWKLRTSCLPDLEKIDCLVSEDFVGNLAVNDYQVDQGMVMILGCEPLAEGVRTTAEGLLADCQSRIALSLDEAKVCELLEIDGRKLVVYQPGEYHLAWGNQRYTVQVEPPPPTVFMLLKQIFGTLQMRAEQLLPEVKVDASLPLINEEASDSAETSGTSDLVY